MSDAAAAAASAEVEQPGVAAAAGSDPATVEELRAEIESLSAQRTAADDKVSAALAYLATTPAGLTDPLVDAEGFPRDDCDLYAVRQARQTVVCGRNDIAGLEAQLFERLAQLHEATKAEAAAQMQRDDAAKQASAAAAEEAEAEAERQRQRQSHSGGDAHTDKAAERAALVAHLSTLPPLLVVASVQPQSPAHDAGLRAGHRVVQYGDINSDNVRQIGLPAVAQRTQAAEGQALSVWVRPPLRVTADGCDEGEVTEITIFPQRWSGNGLLGCALDPI